MKVLFVQKVKGYAGSENWMTSIIPELNKRKVECRLLCIVPPNDLKKLSKFEKDLIKRGVNYTFIISNKNLSYSLLKKIKREATKDNYDLIHLNLIHAEFWFSILKSFFGLKTKLVSTIHGFDEEFQSKHGFNPNKITNTKYIRIMKFCQKRISNYYAVSKGLENLVTKGGIITKDKIRVINCGFDYPKVTINKVVKDEKLIFVPGRVVPYKGQEMVIDSISYLLDKGLKFKIIFAGELQGNYGSYLKNKIDKLGYSSLVSFIGHVSNIKDYYLSADIVVLPSKSEGFGLVLLESFNFEVPVVTFDVPAFNETITNKLTGIITPAFDIELLAKNINMVLSDNILSESLVKNAKSKLLNYYNLDRMTKDTIQFYQDSLS